MKVPINASRLMFLLLVAISFGVKAQDTTLVSRFSSLFAEQNDRKKDSIVDGLIPDFTTFLKVHSSSTFDFKQVKHLGVLESPDKAFTFYLFNLKYRDGSNRHFGFVQQPNGAGFTVTFLNDKSGDVLKPNEEILSPEKWYGALYYQIIPIKSNGRKYYTLLGFSFNNLFTSRKVIEVMELTQSGLVFGVPLFFDGKRSASRIVFEHSARYLMTLQYIPDTKTIVFDHLTSSEANAGTDFQFYGPDGSHDGFVFDGVLWNLKSNIDVRMPQKVQKKKFKTIRTY